VPVAVGGVVPVANCGVGRGGRDGLGRYVERTGASAGLVEHPFDVTPSGR
jgi:hypothetical protein